MLTKARPLPPEILMSMNMKRLFLIVTVAEVIAAVAIGLSLLTSCKGVTDAKTTKTYATLTLAPARKVLYTRYTTTREFLAQLRERPEIGAAYTSFSINFPQYSVDVDAARCKKADVSPNDVLSTLSGYYGGSYSSNFNRFTKLYRQLSILTKANMKQLLLLLLNPARFLATAIGSLVQPLFNKGTNLARLKIAKAQQEEARLSFRQSLLNAGSEVSNALYQFHSAGEKSGERTQQIVALEQSVKYTQALMRLGTSTYLGVLTAQQSLLTAQLTQVSDQFEQMQAVINLYQALGGGR